MGSRKQLLHSYFHAENLIVYGGAGSKYEGARRSLNSK